MNLHFILGVLLGILAALMLNVGKGIQKYKIGVLLHGWKMFARQNRKDLGIWLLGIVIAAGAVLPFSLGLMLSESPSTISAMNGVGLIGLLVFAVKVIGEKIGALDGLGIVLVIAGTSVLGYLGAEREQHVRQFLDRTLVVTILAIVLATAGGCVAALRIRKIHGTTFGLTAGVCIGLAIFLGDAGLIRSDGSFSGQLATPYPYVAIGFGALAIVATQVGFIRGRALEVVPSVNTAIILTPLVLEVVIYHQWPQPACLPFVAIIVVGVFLLSTGAAAKVAA